MTQQPFFASLGIRPGDEGTRTPRRWMPPSRRIKQQPLAEWSDARPAPPTELVPRSNPGDLALVDELLELDAPASVLKVFRCLAKACRRFDSAGTWIRRATISRECRLGRSSVTAALRYLSNSGWIATTPAWIGGEEREVIWCLWLLTETTEPSVQVTKNRTPSSATDARKSAHKERNSLKDSLKKTTDTVVVVVEGSEAGEECPDKQTEGGPREPLPPAIEQLLEGEVKDPAERAQIAARVPEWADKWPGDRIDLAVREVLARRSRGDKILNLAACADGVLRNWHREGKVSVRAVKPPAAPARVPTVEASLTEVARRRQVEALERQHAEAWKQLSAAERASFEQRFDATNPRPPELIPSIWNSARTKGCIELYAQSLAHPLKQ